VVQRPDSRTPPIPTESGIRAIKFPLHFPEITTTKPLPSPPPSLPAVQPGARRRSELQRRPRETARTLSVKRTNFGGKKGSLRALEAPISSHSAVITNTWLGPTPSGPIITHTWLGPTPSGPSGATWLGPTPSGSGEISAGFGCAQPGANLGAHLGHLATTPARRICSWSPVLAALTQIHAS
jgi:hypothetical protein